MNHWNVLFCPPLPPTKPPCPEASVYVAHPLSALSIAVQLKPYICQQCPAKFSRKPYLDIHYRTHTGEKPFQCDICLKRFSQKSSLNIHKTIHTVQGRPFQCTVSVKSF